jgi:hypothetical protein
LAELVMGWAQTPRLANIMETTRAVARTMELAVSQITIVSNLYNKQFIHLKKLQQLTCTQFE